MTTVSAVSDPFVEIDPKEPSWALGLDIFLHNATMALMMFAGILTGGLLTVLYAFATGMLFGNFVAQAVEVAGFDVVLRMVGTHALLELPAFGIACAAGVVPIVSFLCWIVAPKAREVAAGRWSTIVRTFTDSVVLALLAVSALAVSAAVEVWVTPLW